MVSSSYQADSLDRRNYYRHIYEKQPGITGPISFLSAESKQKRQLKKRLIKNDRELFIDYSFPVEWVKRLTGLHDDSLRLFMYRYRPSYTFCRKTDSNRFDQT